MHYLYSVAISLFLVFNAHADPTDPRISKSWFGPPSADEYLDLEPGIILEVEPSKRDVFELLLKSRGFQWSYIDQAFFDARSAPEGFSEAVREGYLVAFVWNAEHPLYPGQTPDEYWRFVRDPFAIAPLIEQFLASGVAKRANILYWDAIGGFDYENIASVHVKNRAGFFSFGHDADPSDAEKRILGFLTAYFSGLYPGATVSLTKATPEEFRFHFEVSPVKNVVLKGYNYWERIRLAMRVSPAFVGSGIKIDVFISPQIAPGRKNEPKPTKYRDVDSEQQTEIDTFLTKIAHAMERDFN